MQIHFVLYKVNFSRPTNEHLKRSLVKQWSLDSKVTADRVTSVLNQGQHLGTWRVKFFKLRRLSSIINAYMK